ENIRRNSGARPGDALILTKALGVGIYSAAIKKDRLPPGAYAGMIAPPTLLNRVGTELGQDTGVNAITDVTGFGLLGHALEMARGSGLTVEIDADAPAVLPGALALAQAGVRTGASGRNWASYGGQVRGADALPDWRRDLLC